MEVKRDIRKRPLIIAGPCSAETKEQTMETYRRMADTGMVDFVRAGVWKPRTSPGCFEGVGAIALEWLSEGKRETGLPFGIEVANAKHALTAVSGGADMIWIGARTTANPFSVDEIAAAIKGSGVKVFIKNPLNPDVDLWSGAVERLIRAGIPREDIGVIHRGFSNYASNGFRNPPMWHLPIEMRRRYPDVTMLCDPSHICGNRETLADTAQKAADLFYDGLLIESHIDPDTALSDAAQQLKPDALKVLLEGIKWRSPDVENPEFAEVLSQCRAEIDAIDAEIFGLLSRRMKVSDRIGEIKKKNNVTILQERRWSEITEKTIANAGPLRLSPEFILKIFEAIHIESIDRQNKVMNDNN